MSIEKILQSLNKLDMLHKSLLEVAYKKTEAIKTSDMDSLNQLLKDEQAHVAGISQLERQRQAEVTDYLRAKGIAPTDNPTVALVLENTNIRRRKRVTNRSTQKASTERLKHSKIKMISTKK